MTRPHDAQTPRTDDKARELTFGYTWGERWNGLLFHARQLELELQAERERGRRLEAAINGAVGSILSEYSAKLILAKAKCAESAPGGGKDG